MYKSDYLLKPNSKSYVLLTRTDFDPFLSLYEKNNRRFELIFDERYVVSHYSVLIFNFTQISRAQ